MNIIAMAFISAGYAVFYWGANQIKHWNRSVTDTEAATLKLLFGLPIGADYQTIHPIPFPFQTSGGNTGNTTPDNTGTKPGGSLSPMYPGPKGMIPGPPIPGNGGINA